MFLFHRFLFVLHMVPYDHVSSQDSTLNCISSGLISDDMKLSMVSIIGNPTMLTIDSFMSSEIIHGSGLAHTVDLWTLSLEVRCEWIHVEGVISSNSWKVILRFPLLVCD